MAQSLHYGHMQISIPGFSLGIIGGGQLGRMMAIEARKLGILTVILDPAERPPAAGLADELIRGSLHDATVLQALAQKVDVVTYEIEHLNIQALLELEADGIVIRPRPALLEIIQDKLRQKQRFLASNLPTPRFWTDQPKTLPIVQKLRTGGYDGRGVKVLRSANDPVLAGASLFEELITIKMELAVLLARGTTGEIMVYPVTEMVFDPSSQICNSVAAPARIPAEIAQQAVDIAVRAITSLDGVGLFAVELFWSADNRLLINEIAPRPHNSGHWTIEGAATNQFEQHIRAVCGLPLGSVELLSPAVMVNILGTPQAFGQPRIHGLAETLALPGVKFHWYQKSTVQPLRKMGHVTVTNPDLETALTMAEKIQATISVTGDKEPTNGQSK